MGKSHVIPIYGHNLEFTQFDRMKAHFKAIVTIVTKMTVTSNNLVTITRKKSNKNDN